VVGPSAGRAVCALRCTRTYVRTCACTRPRQPVYACNTRHLGIAHQQPQPDATTAHSEAASWHAKGRERVRRRHVNAAVNPPCPTISCSMRRSIAGGCVSIDAPRLLHTAPGRLNHPVAAPPTHVRTHQARHSVQATASHAVRAPNTTSSRAHSTSTLSSTPGQHKATATITRCGARAPSHVQQPTTHHPTHTARTCAHRRCSAANHAAATRLLKAPGG
jgi:hypothetical protein